MNNVHVVILAAGKGTRMKSTLPKVLHRVAGVPMIEYVLSVASQLSPSSTTVVVGHGADAVQAALSTRPRLSFVLQQPQLGTAHALLTTAPLLEAEAGTVVLLSGDVPLLSGETLQNLIDKHDRTQAAASVVTAVVGDPSGYGRIVRDGEQIARIVEERDASAAERQITEINSGIYAFALDGLFQALRSVATENAQREYYLPDLVDIYRRCGRRVETTTVKNPIEIRGINSRAELAEASRIVRDAKNAQLMASGVTLEDPATTYVGRDVEIGADTVIHPCVHLEGRTVIGSGCEIHQGVRITDSRIGDGVTVYDHSVLDDATIESNAEVGPFARLRGKVVLRAHAKVGNFVEMKNTVFGAGSKAMHLTYLGDAVIGEGVNVGAGTITCNYDGIRKQTTTIEDGAFIGSDTQLIAPVTVGRDAYVGTGTTIREDVPPGALAVSAGKQRNIEGWVEKKGRGKKDESRR
jgi:bifunctional UDP-N-acetylglucosamine pyrophosphorylase/glucosamine-1-phosphate N-acetyltransferase